jgi:type IV secretion system protein TrbL
VNPGIFAQLLHALQQALQPGLGAMRPYILGLFGFLAFLELVRLAAGWVLGAAGVPQSAIRFLLRSGVLLWVVLEYPLMVSLVMESFVKLGLIAGGQAITVAQFLDPGAYLAIGIQVGDVLYQRVTANIGLSTIPMALAYLVAWVFFLLAYGVMALSVFILQVEFTLTIMAAVVMLPFAVLHGTGWIAQGAISYPLNVGFRFFILALLASVVFPLLGQITTPTGVVATLQHAVVMILAAWMMAFLFYKGPQIAAGILAGMPSLSAGQVLQAAAGTALVGGAALTLGSAAAGAGMRVVGGTIHGATRSIATASTAYQIGSAATVGGKMASVGGGVRSMATAGVRAISSGATSSLRQSVLAGQRAGWVHSGGTLPRAAQTATIAPRHAPVGRALQDALAKSARYFSNDTPHRGTHADID